MGITHFGILQTESAMNYETSVTAESAESYPADLIDESEARASRRRRWIVIALVALVVLAGVAFFVQLQIPRVFWLIDVVATIYVVGALAEGVPGARARRAAAVAAVVAVAAAGRGLYVMLVERPGRPLR